MKKNYSIILIFFLAINYFSHGQTFVKDFYSIKELVTLENQSFFVASDDIHGTELWKTDGTTKGTSLVKDINKVNSSNPKNLTVFNGEIYFSADDGVFGTELWKTDGTKAGTLLVKDIHENHRASSNPHGFIIYNNELYFIAKDYYLNSGYELWKTDGTEAGTVKVYETKPHNISNLIVANNRLYVLYDGLQEFNSSAGELTKIDIDDYNLIYELNTFNNELYFITSDSYYRRNFRLYKLGVDNTPVLLQTFSEPQYGDIDIHNLTQIGDEVYFSITTDFNSGTETDVLWKTDGTSVGTVQVKTFDWDRHWSGSNISNFIGYNGQLYFNSGSQNNFELWKSDGSQSGTLKALNIQVNNLFDFFKFNNKLYFSSNNNLWYTNGTEEGTKKFSDLIITSKTSDDLFNINSTKNTIIFESNFKEKKALYTTVSNPFIEVKKNYSVLENNATTNLESKIDSVDIVTINIKNKGNKDLVFSKIEVIGQGFYIDGKHQSNVDGTNPEGNFPQLIKPNEQYKFEIIFFPSISGFKKGSLNILSNDVVNPTFVLDLVGFAEEEIGLKPSESISLDKEISFNTTNLQIAIDNNTISENLIINSLVGVLSIPDNNGIFTYELISGEGDYDNHSFTIENNELKTNAVFDFDLKNTFTIRVKATDSFNQVIEEIIIISVSDITEDIILKECTEDFINMSFGFLDVDFIDSENVVAIGTHGIIIKSNDGGQNWAKISHAAFGHLWDLQFTSDKIGYIIGDYQVLKTEDAGESWFPLQLPDISYPFPRNLAFINSEVGFVFGNDGKIFKTTDGGKYWKLKDLGFTDFNSAFFLNESKGFITGRSETLVKTLDGGESWENVDLEIDGLRYNISLTNIYFVNEEIGYITGNYGEIIKTIDGGDTWTQISKLEYNINTNDLLFLDENIGYIIAKNYIYKTIDGGITWIRDDDLPNLYPSAVSISDNNEHICVVGTGGSGWLSDMGSSINYKYLNNDWKNVSFFRGNANIYSTYFSGDTGYIFGEAQSAKTTDGGLTWKKITPPETYIIQIEVLNNNIYILGRDNIYKSIDSGETWTILAASNYYKKLFFINEQVIYTIAQERGLFKSIDGGLNWVNVNDEFFGETDMYFKNESEGYAVGIGGMIKTEDGGNSFNNVELELENGYSFLYSIKFFNENIGIAGSGNGIIYKTIDGGLTWTKIYTVIRRNVKFIHPVSELEWYAVGVYGGTSVMYKSIDGGVNWLRKHIADDNIYDVHADNENMYLVGQYGSFYKMTNSSIPNLPGHIEGNIYVTAQSKEEYSIIKEPNVNYRWAATGDNQLVYNDNKAAISWNAHGTYLVTVTPINNCGTGTSREITVVVEENPNPMISGNIEVNEFSLGNDYYTNLNGNSRYNWFVKGHQNFNTDANTISIDWGESGIGEIEVIETKTLSGARKNAQLFVTINAALDVDDFESGNNLVVYPNPAEGLLHINLNNTPFYHNTKIDLIDLSGRVYRSKTFQNENKIEFELNRIESGIYFLRISIDNKRYAKKIIKI